MFELIQSGGLLMIPIIFCSVIAMGIVGERFWTLRKNKILPPEWFPRSGTWLKQKNWML